MLPSEWRFRWSLLRWQRNEKRETVLAQGEAATVRDARLAVLDAEKRFPVPWLPEVHYCIEDSTGSEQEHGGICLLEIPTVLKEIL